MIVRGAHHQLAHGGEARTEIVLAGGAHTIEQAHECAQASDAQATVPMLALNRANVPPPACNASFSLSPEDDGIAAAEFLIDQKAHRVLVINGVDDGLRRASGALHDALAERGGVVVDSVDMGGDAMALLTRLQASVQKAGQVDAVFHEGACSDTMETDGKYMMANNYGVSLALYQACQQRGTRLLYASDRTVDQARRRTLLVAAQQRIADLAVEIPLYNVTRLDAVPANLEGFTGNPTNAGIFWNVHQWKIK